MFRMILPAALALVPALASPLSASTDEAWETFRADVEAKCLALQGASGSQGETVIEVNRFGSERFGAALLTTTLAGGGQERAVCIYDKQAQTAELTAPFDEPPAPIGTAAPPEQKPVDPAPPVARSDSDAGAERPTQAP